jgi:hypothetical protein
LVLLALDETGASQAFLRHSVKLQHTGGSTMKIRPLHDRVIVKRLEEERKTASGIVIPTPPPRSPIRAK